MKKLVASAAMAVVLAAALYLAGCGDQGKAAEYMKNGDELSQKMRSLTYSADFDTVALLAKLGLKVSETGGVKPVTDEAAKQLDAIIANGEKAKAEYEKILRLRGVEDYKAYAEKRISAIDDTTGVLKALKELLGQLGDPGNTASTQSIITSWAKDNTEAAADAVKAYLNWRDAENIRKDKGLGRAGEAPGETAPSSRIVGSGTLP